MEVKENDIERVVWRALAECREVKYLPQGYDEGAVEESARLLGIDLDVDELVEAIVRFRQRFSLGLSSPLMTGAGQ